MPCFTATAGPTSHSPPPIDAASRIAPGPIVRSALRNERGSGSGRSARPQAGNWLTTSAAFALTLRNCGMNTSDCLRSMTSCIRNKRAEIGSFSNLLLEHLFRLDDLFGALLHAGSLLGGNHHDTIIVADHPVSAGGRPDRHIALARSARRGIPLRRHSERRLGQTREAGCAGWPRYRARRHRSQLRRVLCEARRVSSILPRAPCSVLPDHR